MNEPTLTVTVKLTPSGAFAVCTEYSHVFSSTESERMKAVFIEHAVKRVTLELENCFKKS
jgi:hypothetical protein